MNSKETAEFFARLESTTDGCVHEFLALLPFSIDVLEEIIEELVAATWNERLGTVELPGIQDGSMVKIDTDPNSDSPNMRDLVDKVNVILPLISISQSPQSAATWRLLQTIFMDSGVKTFALGFAAGKSIGQDDGLNVTEAFNSLAQVYQQEPAPKEE